MEASCKTLVTQRLKRSGMAWTNAGGQAILTLRSLIQSNRWPATWGLLSADFRKTVTVLNQPTVTTSASSQTQPRTLPATTRPVGPVAEEVVVRHPMGGVVGFLRVFEQDARLQLGPMFLADPGKFEFWVALSHG